MIAYDYSRIETIIIEPQLGTLRLMRDTLARLGMKRLQGFTSLAELPKLLESSAPDLIMADADSPDSDLFKIIRWLRNDPMAANPFPCVIVSTWTPTAALVARASTCGADDMLIKPASQRQVQERIVNLIENRRKFVVTADYIGPDRRKAQRDGKGGGAPLIDAPNTLRLKAAGQWDKINARDLIVMGKARVHEQKLIRIGVQLAFLIEYALPDYQTTTPGHIAADHVARMPALIEDLLRRLDESEVERAVGEAARALKVAVLTLQTSIGGEEHAAYAQQVRELAFELMATIEPARAKEALIQEVDAVVANYRQHLARLAAAKQAGEAVPGPA